MSERSILTLANGSSMNLRFPTPADYADPHWLAEHLAKIKRYLGATPGMELSVAQHACNCCDAAMNEYGDPLVAAYCLAHDNHEAAWGDDPTPKKFALAEEANDKLGVLAESIMEVFAGIIERHDVAAHAAAGLAWPPPYDHAAKVKRIDRTMLVTEWRELMPGIALPAAASYADVEPIDRRIRPWPWMMAKNEYLDRAYRLYPAVRKELVG